MSIKEIIKYYLVWQIFIVVITLFAIRFLPLQITYLAVGAQTYKSNSLLYSRANFDGDHYRRIAQSGYGYAEEAFFPLYPNLIKFLEPFTHNPITSGLVISLSAFLLALIILSKLLLIDYSEKVVKWTIVVLLIFPTSFFFTSVYTEGLFFLLVVASFYTGRKGRWWLAGILIAMASYTRFVGIFLVPSLLVEFWLQHKDFSIKKKLIRITPILLGSCGLLFYMYYLWQTKHDPLAFFHVQKHYGQFRSENVILLYQVFWRYVKMIWTVEKSSLSYLNVWFEAIIGLLFLVTTIVSMFRTRLSYTLFGLFAYLVPTLTGSFVSLPRYVLVCFASFIVIGEFLAKYKDFQKLYLSISGLLFIIFLSLFVRGYWVG